MNNDAQMYHRNGSRRIAALIVAAGSGSRMQAENGASPALPKQFMDLGGVPVLAHSLSAFATHPAIAAIAIVTAPDHSERARKLTAGIASDIAVTVVDGGATRQESVRAGLAALATSGAELVAIHDAARPLLTHDVIDRLASAMDEGARAALPVLPIADTIKQTKDSAITGTIDRSHAAAAQTPQMFSLVDIIALHDAQADNPAFTDDISLIEASGGTVAAVAGSQHLMKITRNTDMIMVSALLAQRAGAPSIATVRDTVMTERQKLPDIRLGNGFDVHKFSDAPGPIMLAGIAVPSDHGMSAHSDGDVGLHALCDAIFGALADGDIGSHFPPSDPQWKNADSAQFLTYAMKRCADRGAIVTHLDLTIICEYPKITPHRDTMRARIADITGLPIDRVGVKATTSEGLGFTGRREGIAAQATATLAFPAVD